MAFNFKKIMLKAKNLSMKFDPDKQRDYKDMGQQSKNVLFLKFEDLKNL